MQPFPLVLLYYTSNRAYNASTGGLGVKGAFIIRIECLYPRAKAEFHPFFFFIIKS